MERYSAKLLFQYRVVTNGSANKKRTCEERIIIINSRSAKDALAKAKKHGAKSEHKYKNDSGGIVLLEFVGVLDLQHLGIECEPNEVWYGIKEILKPMERRKSLIPSESKLSAIVWEKRAQQGTPADAKKRRG